MERLYVTSAGTYSILDPLPGEKFVHSITREEIKQLQTLYQNHPETKHGFDALMENGRGSYKNVVGFTIALIKIKGPMQLYINSLYLSYYLSDVVILNYAVKNPETLSNFGKRSFEIYSDGSTGIKPW